MPNDEYGGHELIAIPPEDWPGTEDEWRECVLIMTLQAANGLPTTFDVSDHDWQNAELEWNNSEGEVRVRGGCDHCDAYCTMDVCVDCSTPHPTLCVHHDDDCQTMRIEVARSGLN